MVIKNHTERKADVAMTLKRRCYDTSTVFISVFMHYNIDSWTMVMSLYLMGKCVNRNPYLYRSSETRRRDDKYSNYYGEQESYRKKG